MRCRDDIDVDWYEARQVKAGLIAWGGRTLANGQTRPHLFQISAGTSDAVEFWQEQTTLFVLSRNRRMGYISVDKILEQTGYEFETTINEPISVVFYNDHELNKKGKDPQDMRGDHLLRWMQASLALFVGFNVARRLWERW